MEFTHGGLTGTQINIYKFENGVLEGTFFTKDKPTIGDTITYDRYLLTVNEIIENRDAKITKGCTHNPKLAYFKLRVS